MRLAIIGGGRWGRVHLSVAQQIGLTDLNMVTSHNVDKIPAGVKALPSINTLLKNPPTAAIVANSARDHFAAANQLLEASVHVLVEKPVVLAIDEAEKLIAEAQQKKLCLLPGLNLRFASYLHRFAKEISKSKRVTLHWADAAGEMRGGEKKRYDSSISVAQDVMPHVWSIFSVLFPTKEFIVTSGDGTRFMLQAEGVEAEVMLQRDAPARKRLITVDDISLDFTTEPGTISKNGKSFSGDEQWGESPKPLERQLRYFLECIEQGSSAESDIEALRHSVRLST